MKSTNLECIDKGEILKLCSEKFSAPGLSVDKEQMEINFLSKNV